MRTRSPAARGVAFVVGLLVLFGVSTGVGALTDPDGDPAPPSPHVQHPAPAPGGSHVMDAP